MMPRAADALKRLAAAHVAVISAEDALSDAKGEKNHAINDAVQAGGLSLKASVTVPVDDGTLVTITRDTTRTYEYIVSKPLTVETL